MRPTAPLVSANKILTLSGGDFLFGGPATSADLATEVAFGSSSGVSLVARLKESLLQLSPRASGW